MSHLTTTVRFRCPDCGAQVEEVVPVPEVDWVTEPMSDSVTEGDIDMECGQCHSSFSGRVQNSPAGCFVELHEYPNLPVQAHDAPFARADSDDEDWLDSAPPDRPFDVITSTMFHLDDLTAEYALAGKAYCPIRPR